jgi:hypothetical protein
VQVPEAAANAAAGQRVNIISGTYTLAANLTFPNGSNESPIHWQGYTSTIGDLIAVGRASDTAALTVTNFPVIDATSTPYTITSGTFNNFINLKFTSAGNALLFTLAKPCGIWRCRLENTHTTGTSVTLFSSAAAYQVIYDCDLVSGSSGNGLNVVNLVNRGNLTACRIWNTNASPSTSSSGVEIQGLAGVLSRCILFNHGTGVKVSGGYQLANNTIYNCNLGVSISDVNDEIALTENIIYNMNTYGIGGSEGGSALLINNAIGAVTSGRIDTGGLGTIVAEIDEVVLTGDPFTNAASQDFTLNNTSGAGALCRNASQMWGGDDDLGAVRHADPAGGGGLLVHPGMAGGMRG